MCDCRALPFLCLLLCVATAAAATASCNGPATDSAEVLSAVVAFLQPLEPAGRVEAEAIGGVPLVHAAAMTLKTAWPGSRTAVQMRWTECGTGAVQSRVVWFRTRAYRTVWRYGREGRPDTPLHDAAPVRAEMDVAPWHLRDEDMPAMTGDEFLVRAVNAGMPVRRGDLKPAPLVLRNEDVTVEVQGNGVLLRTRGKALQYGAAGDTIAVQVTNAEKSTQARVVAQGVVHVDI